MTDREKIRALEIEVEQRRQTAFALHDKLLAAEAQIAAQAHEIEAMQKEQVR